MRVNQFKLFADPQRALTLAKAVVKAKISNQRTLQLMLAFAPMPEQRRNPADPGPDRQQDLFASLLAPGSRKA